MPEQVEISTASTISEFSINKARTLNDSSGNTVKLEDLIMTQFQWYDYILFLAMLGLSVMIGLYYAFCSKHKQNNIKEYIMGGNTLKSLPVAVSLVSSYTSGATLLGIPSEVYSHGTQYIVFILSVLIVAILLIYVYIPLFFELQLTSIFQYLERRFDRKVRLLDSFIYTIFSMLFMPLVLFVPALAFKQVTGYNVYLTSTAIGITCVFYTMIGGLRAVVWTDFLQCIVALGAMCTIIYLGTLEVGGVSKVFESAERGGRLILFDMDPSPFRRNTFWTIGCGMTVLWVSGLGVGQSCIQRFLSVPNLKKARQSVWIFAAGMIIIKLCALYFGMLVYARYENCDPIQSKLVQKSDQIIPLYVSDISHRLPGLSGLWIAALFASGLSNMSSVLNSLSGTIFEDFLRPHLPKVTEGQTSIYMKSIVLTLGVCFTCLIFLIEKFGSVFQAATSIGGITAGCHLGLFTLGMTCKTVNTKGILAGAMTSMLLVLFIIVGAYHNDIAKEPSLPVSIENCKGINKTMTSATTPAPGNNSNEVFWLFRISFYYYSVIGLVTMMIVSYIVSLITGGNTNYVDESLMVSWFRSQNYKKQPHENVATYKDLNGALNELVQKDEIEKNYSH